MAGTAQYNFKRIKIKGIHLIRPLWEKLNEIHFADSRYFKDHYRTFTFEKRCEKFMDLDEHSIRIEVVRNVKSPVGYCIATIDSTAGEIDSIFVDEEHRKRGLGGELMEHALTWLREKDPEKIVVAVADGHESLIRFYREYGFYPRMTYLQMKETL